MNILFTTVCNDRYTNALALLLWSIKHHNPDFTYPFKVYHKGDLSEACAERIKFIYPNTVFENVNKKEYSSKICHYLALESFREFEPDLVIFIDSDIICLGDISELTKLHHPISAAIDYDLRLSFPFTACFPFSPLARINTGVFTLDKTYRNQETYDALFSVLDKFPDKRVKGQPWSDQGIMNQYFKKSAKYIFPYIYNGRKNLFPNSKFKAGAESALNNVRLIHFGGTCKPFLGGLKNVPPTSKHHKYSELHKVYYDYWDKMVKDLGVDWSLQPEETASSAA